ncbi:hypothetical protein DPMN_051433 [Dreissena polymorpha]|uniref:Uncharacterized protein n=1 Tax=Dreissena polymorpha TaxID=45954 RepID=A0A9D4CJB5_DREPO|nr:hypothetical protein DPMN_051433 [Dreissena polymorpha]
MQLRKTHNLTKFHEDGTKNVTSRRILPDSWQPEINETNVMTKFHWAKIVTSRVFTRNTTPAPGGHASNVTSTVFTRFELSRGINGTNVPTKFHEDRTINVASRVFTRQNVDDTRQTTHKRRSQKLT